MTTVAIQKVKNKMFCMKDIKKYLGFNCVSKFDFFIFWQAERLVQSGLVKTCDMVRLNAFQRSEEVGVLKSRL